MTDMQGKRGLIVGIANERSYAWYIAQSLIEHGAECIFTHLPGEKMERRCRKAIEAIGIENPTLISMDAGSDDDLDRVFGELGEIDFLVHSIAFADRDWLKEGKFAATPRGVYTQALDISAYTLMAMANQRASTSLGGVSIAVRLVAAEMSHPLLERAS